jgi:TonB family protein
MDPKELQISSGRFGPVLIGSVIFHVVVFLVFPLATHIFWKPKEFVRPRTFQLVSMPAPQVRQQAKPLPKPVSRPEPSPSRPKPAPQKAPAAKPAPKKPDPVPSREEDLSDLEELLGGMQPPASELSFGGEIQDWYKSEMVRQIERNWRPPREDPDLATTVQFTVLMNGHVTGLRVSKSSGNVSVDNMAIRAVKLAAPFGKLPPSYSSNRLEANLVLRATRR